MNTIPVSQTMLAFEVQGTGESVLLLHCGLVAHACHPLLQETVLTRDFMLINYHRRGYGASGSVQPPFSLELQAADCLALMDYLRIPQVHVVGHSYGANVALELVRRAPERVATLALLEPPLGFALTPASRQMLESVIVQAMQSFLAGEVATAVNAWLTGAFGPGWQEVVNQKLPGSYEQVVKDGPTALAVEAPVLQMWDYGSADLQQIQQPVLAVAHPDPRFSLFDEVQYLLVERIPHVESLVVPHVTHLMQIQDTRAVAESLAAFLARHPLPADARVYRP